MWRKKGVWEEVGYIGGIDDVRDCWFGVVCVVVVINCNIFLGFLVIFALVWFFVVVYRHRQFSSSTMFCLFT